MSRPAVVVVGGGLAGLAAGLACVDGGAQVTLVERQPRLGGATWSFTRDGRSFDNGQHVFLRCCEAYRGFLERLGVADLTHLQSRLDVPVLRPGLPPARLWRAPLPVPAHLAGALATYGPIPLRERLGVARTALALSRVDPADPDSDRRSFGEWLGARPAASAAATAALWDLILRPTCNLPAEECSLSMAAKVFRTGLFETPGGGDIGWSRVPLWELHGSPALAALRRAGATVLTGSTAGQVRAGRGGRLVVHCDGTELDADAVVLAVPHQALRGLLPGGALDVAVEDLGSSPVVNVQVVYDRRVTELPVAAALGSPVQWVFDRTSATGLSEGQCLGVSLSAADEWLGRRPHELVERFTVALCELFPSAMPARVLDAVVTKERWATFAARPGTAALRPGTRTGTPGLFLAGSWTDTGWPATMEGAVRSGVAAARAALVAVDHHRALPEEVPA